MRRLPVDAELVVEEQVAAKRDVRGREPIAHDERPLGKVRVAKLYFLRGLEGKAARIKEDISAVSAAKAAAKSAAAE